MRSRFLPAQLKLAVSCWGGWWSLWFIPTRISLTNGQFFHVFSVVFQTHFLLFFSLMWTDWELSKSWSSVPFFLNNSVFIFLISYQAAPSTSHWEISPAKYPVGSLTSSSFHTQYDLCFSISCCLRLYNIFSRIVHGIRDKEEPGVSVASLCRLILKKNNFVVVK